MNNIFSKLNNKIFKILSRNIPSNVSCEYDYYSQWESKELVDKILKGEISAKDDPNWSKSGAENQLEYLNWSWNACGMAFFKMILKKRKNKIFKIIDLAKECTEFGGYKINEIEFDKGNYLK